MKSPSRVSYRVILLVLFSHLLILSDGSPISDGLSGNPADIWVDTTLKKFYGPWPSLRKANGQDVDYGDYGAFALRGPRFGSEEYPPYAPEIADVAPGDFPSNYEVSDSDVLFAPSAADQSSSIGRSGDDDPNDLENRDENGNLPWTSAAM